MEFNLKETLNFLDLCGVLPRRSDLQNLTSHGIFALRASVGAGIEK